MAQCRLRAGQARRRSERAVYSEIGKRVKRFIAASSLCAIRDGRDGSGGACRDGGCSNRVLLAAGAEEYERQELPRRA
jgi:hypothetical protein